MLCKDSFKYIKKIDYGLKLNFAKSKEATLCGNKK